MKKPLILVSVLALVTSFIISTIAFADDLVPGAYGRQDQSVMGVSKTMLDFGASDRSRTDALNRASNAAFQQSQGRHGESFYMFGSSQSDQSWKAARTVEEAQVRGLVPNDCQGDNSDGTYRKQMKQNRKGYTEEKLVSNAQCGINHATITHAAVK